ncbi:MAG: hypothetical protein D6718_04170 [Acidobacteria bacterium]|nr:MAG: hypothetical protein D6718_04170 [Acidobacteriota bacterium]
MLALTRADPNVVLPSLERRRVSNPTPERELVEIETTRDLGEKIEPERKRAICRLAGTSGDEAVRSRAAVACLELAAARPEDLARWADDPSWVVRTRVAVWLAGHPGAVPGDGEALARLARDPHATVRHAARAGGIGTSSARRAGDRLRKARTIGK